METYEKAGEMLATSTGPVAALTGAGISAESGLATFRGSGGLWRGNDPMSLATPEAFVRDPKLVWEFYGERRRLALEAEPNAAHLALVELARQREFTLVTQNVDGLHERAGSDPVVRLHGSLFVSRCVECGSEERDRRSSFAESPPRCSCGGSLRPGVVWFGESLPFESWQRAEAAMSAARLLLVIGTSARVQPAAGLVGTAREAGAAVIEINPEASAIAPWVDVHVAAGAAVALPRILDAAGIRLE